MKKELYIFRHGQTNVNLERRWQGQSIDAPLNKTGFQQAEQLAQTLSGKGIGEIYSSPLLRAFQTAQTVGKRLNIPVFKNDGLIEGCFGVAEGKTLAQLNELYPETTESWKSLEENTWNVRFENGETKREIMNRVRHAIDTIAAAAPVGIIGISAHSAAIRCLLLSFSIKKQQIPHGTPFHIILDI